MTCQPTTDVARVLFITKSDFRGRRNGGHQRTAALVDELRASGLAVDVIAVRPIWIDISAPPRTPDFRAWIETIRMAARFIAPASAAVFRWFNPLAALRISAQLAQMPYQVIVIDYSHLTPYVGHSGTPLVASLHNVEHVLLSNYQSSAGDPIRSLLARYESYRMRRLEERLPTHFDVVGFVSANDRDTLRLTRQPGGCTVAEIIAPNGTKDECFDYSGPRDLNVVFVASLDWRPNVDAASWLVHQVWPHVERRVPRAKLVLVGSNPSPSVRKLARYGAEVVADVADTVPFVGGAAVATAPLLAAGGTRLKILEALACGTPVVATSLGALGLEHLIGDYLKVADDPVAFADSIIECILNPPDRNLVRAQVATSRWPIALEPLVNAIRAQALSDGRSSL